MEEKTVAIIGATGLIGSALAQAYEVEGWRVTRISRKLKEVPGQIWKVYSADAIEGAEVVLNFSGASIDKRWTESYKKQLRESRVGVAKEIAGWIDKMENPPRVWVNASAVGVYGDRDDEILVEDSIVGEGFLEQLCVDWEDATELGQSSCRVVNPRIGVVLSSESAAWKKLLLPFKFFVGGKLGEGRQYFPWIHLQDVVGSIMHCVENESIEGAVNLAAPEQITNAQFTKQLANHLHRPSIFTVPRFVLHFMLGEFAGALLASLRVEPMVLKSTHYQFRYQKLEQVFEKEL